MNKNSLVLPTATCPVTTRVVNKQPMIVDVAVEVRGLTWHTTVVGDEDHRKAVAQAYSFTIVPEVAAS